ncbi:MAG: putative molybdenum carrier protein [Azoarcus sp.]|jgi:hypothetical protein|nr:putative molybdenum carrier protein [Azoarcus sp.]
MSEIHYTIMPEYGGVYDWIKAEGTDRPDLDRIRDWQLKHPISDGLHRAFLAWLREFGRAPVDSAGIADMDWLRFNDIGIDLTRRVKMELGDAARVFYVKAYEDPNGYLNERVEILANGSIVKVGNPMPLRKRLYLPSWFPTMIVSGGQTGVDRAALDWACGHRIPHGGWAPHGRKAEDGVIPPKYQLAELEKGGYRQRTRRNVEDSDATLIVNLDNQESGTLATRTFAQQMGKPHFVAQLDSCVTTESAASVIAWLREHTIETLNVAGPRESRRPGIYCLSLELLDAIVAQRTDLTEEI